MADTRAASGLTPQQWDEEFFTESIAEDRFADLYGKTENAPIQIKEDLSKKKGDSVTFALLNRLTNDATTGSDTLEGSEEELGSRSHRVYVNKRRNAVRVSEMEEQKSAIGLRDAAKPALKMWAHEDTRDRIIAAMHSKNGVAYGTATEAEKDAWLVDNQDRVLFGAAVANHVSLDHSTSLATVDSTNDVLKRASISLLKRRIRTATPKIRPLKDPKNGKLFYVGYAHPLLMRDLRSDMESVLDDTTAAGEAMRLFEGGDLYWDGCIIKELEDAPLISGVGNGGIDVAPFFLLGAQAIGYAICRKWRSKDKEFDYGDKFGVAVDAIDGFEKLRFGTGSGDTDDTKDNGMATGYFAAVAD